MLTSFFIDPIEPCAANSLPQLAADTQIFLRYLFESFCYISCGTIFAGQFEAQLCAEDFLVVDWF